MLTDEEKTRTRARFSLSKDDLVLISSTSWTEDEHFEVLFQALLLLDAQIGREVTVIITGKGPEKGKYEKMIREKRWGKVKIRMEWVESEEYPRILAAADWGISLHASSSGLDLPMKVVDMMGAGLPVLTLYYPTIKELVQTGVNGEYFIDEASLAGLILVRDRQTLQSDEEKRGKYRKAMEVMGRKRWEEEWEMVVKPGLFRSKDALKSVLLLRFLTLVVIWWVLRLILGFFCLSFT